MYGQSHYVVVAPFYIFNSHISHPFLYAVASRFVQRVVVADVVGYFIRPEATALDCVNVASAPIDVATGNRSFETISCAAGYTVTGGGVGTGTNLNSYVNGSYALTGTSWFSSVQNASGSTRSYTHYATCCRVPGR